MRYANIYIYIFVLHRGFFQQPRGRVGIANLRLDALTNKYMNINTSSIANLGYRTPSWQCRRGDASPPGELASPPDEDARGVTEPKQYQMQKTRYKAFELCSALYEKAWPFVIKRQILKCNRPRLIFMFY